MLPANNRLELSRSMITVGNHSFSTPRSSSAIH
jgi:hypothetical protein